MASSNLIVRGFLAFRGHYNKLLDTHPTSTQVATAGTLYCVGDLVCQAVEGKEKLDFHRAARMTGMGVLLMGVAGSKWYHFIDRLLPATNTPTVIKKVVLDQFCFAPAFYLSFYAGMSLLEGHTVSHTVDHIKKKFIPTYIADLTFWPAAQAINFKYVSPPNRVLYISTLCIGWNAFLSHLQHNDVKFTMPSFLSSKPTTSPQLALPSTSTSPKKPEAVSSSVQKSISHN